MTNLLRVTALLLCMVLYGSTSVQAQDGTAPDPLANCPPANTQTCVYVDYPANALNNCPMEICLEYYPTPYLQSLCPVAWNGNMQYPCVTVMPGQTHVPICFNAPAGNVNTFYTIRFKITTISNPFVVYQPITVGSPLYGPHLQGAGCYDAVFVNSTDGYTYVFQNDLIVH